MQANSSNQALDASVTSDAEENKISSSRVRSTAELSHEESVLRNPYSLEVWLSYISHQTTSPPSSKVFRLYERAVAALPGSYKLWRQYVLAFRSFSQTQHPRHPSREAALLVSRRAAEALRVSPVLWIQLIEHLISEGRWTLLTEAVNTTLRALPITQHENMWKKLIPNLQVGQVPPRMAVALLRRYAILRPGFGRERLIEFMIAAKLWDEASLFLCECLSDPKWNPTTSTKEEYWLQLASILARHPGSVVSIDVPSLLRDAANQASNDAGELWIALGEHFTRKGLFDDARNVYEEAMGSIQKVKDFALVFEAYATFAESLAAAAVEELEELRKEQEKDEEAIREAQTQADFQLARLENLTARREMLLSDVCLKQNPHDVHEWHKRARMYKDANDPPHVVDTYTNAVRTVDPWRAKEGRPHTLWLAFATYYERSGDVESARKVIEKAVEDPENFAKMEDLATIWCEYAEMELRCSSTKNAREVLKRAVVPRKRPRQASGKGTKRSNAEAIVGVGEGAGDAIIRHQSDNSSPAWDAHKSKRLWSFLLDLTQSTCPPEEVVTVHDEMLKAKVATVRTILNGAAYLQSQRLFEQAFKLYDKGATALPWPQALEIWVLYITKFMERFGGRKMERLRNLFEEAIQSAPATRKAGKVIPHPQLKLLFIMYAAAEEKYSSPRWALKVYSKAVNEVREEDKADLYRLYIVKIATSYGVTKTRPVYEQAITTLRLTEDVMEFVVRFAEMETRLGDHHRARAIYVQTCSIADTRASGIFEEFWTSWNDFELEHGNEDTFRDMLRAKKDVQLNYKGPLIDKTILEGLEPNSLKNMIKDSGNDDHDKKEHEVAEKGDQEKGPSKVGEPGRNEEEISIDLSDSDDEEKEIDENITEGAGKGVPGKESESIPKSLGLLQAAARAFSDKKDDIARLQEDDRGEKRLITNNGEEEIGALERFKRRKET